MSRKTAAVGRAVALEQFHAQSDSELPLCVGAEVTIYRFEGAPGWWLGGAHGRVGWFPTSFVGSVVRYTADDAAAAAAADTADTAPPVVQRTAMALFSYTRRAPDELTFRAGDTIAVAETSLDGFVFCCCWWCACIKRRRLNGACSPAGGFLGRCKV
jgi:hypothetical protein